VAGQAFRPLKIVRLTIAAFSPGVITAVGGAAGYGVRQRRIFNQERRCSGDAANNLKAPPQGAGAVIGASKARGGFLGYCPL
jgi:hypothetical protein